MSLLNELDLANADENIKDPADNVRKIRYLKSQCYVRLGELTQDKRRAVDYFGKGLLEKRAVRTDRNTKDLIIEEASICSKLGNVLYQAELYS